MTTSRRHLATWLGLAVGLSLLGSPRSAQADEAFTITSFHDDIRVNADASLDVTEQIGVDFGTNERHGIFRTIPTRYDAGNGVARSIRVSDIRVDTDPATVSRSFNDLTVKIGDANQLVSGPHAYTIRYHVANALNAVNDTVELYWNVTGNGWDTTIDKATATVTLPQPVEPGRTRQVAYEGIAGSTIQTLAQADGTAGFAYAADRQLAANEGLTIVASWPPGLVTLPSAATKLRWFLADNWPLGIPLLVLGFVVWRFVVAGRDPHGRGTIVPEFAAPKDLTLLDVAALRSEGFDDRALTALIIRWAVDGFLTIQEPTKGAYELTKQRALAQGSPAETKLFARLFSSGDTVRLRDIQHDTQLVAAKTALRTETLSGLAKRGYFVSNPDTVRALYLVAGVVLMVGAVSLAGVLGFVGTFAGFASGLIVAAAAPFMPKRTPSGVDKKEQIQGFELYLKTAERYRMEFAEKERLFEKFLPYAIAFGVAGLWAKAFKDIATEAPSWYSGYYGSNWSTVNFANGLSGNLASSLSGITTASSGGSGFSGGSGGGFGGGGGGSW